MKFVEFDQLLGGQPFFDIGMAAQMTGEPRQTLRTQLYRWMRSGKLLALRRGMYAFADSGRHRGINPAALANFLYRPSYLSTYWALGYYGIIPERVVELTSITTRVPREFVNDFGTFRYSNIKQQAFFGYRATSIDGDKVLLAEPEKALLDLWHLARGAWNGERMKAMRFQAPEMIDRHRLEDYAAKFRSPRLARAVGVWADS